MAGIILTNDEAGTFFLIKLFAKFGELICDALARKLNGMHHNRFVWSSGFVLAPNYVHEILGDGLQVPASPLPDLVGQLARIASCDDGRVNTYCLAPLGLFSGPRDRISSEPLCAKQVT